MKLVWSDNGKHGEKIVTQEIPVIIGRSFECDIVLSDPYVSRYHAVAGYEDGALILRSLSTRNPIIVNDDIQLKSSQSCVLKEGDEFLVGQVKLEASAPETSSNANDKRTMELNRI